MAQAQHPACNEATLKRLDEIRAEVEAMPDPSRELFDSVGEYKIPCGVFFGDLMARYRENPGALEDALDLDGDAVQVYKRLNSPTHAVRNRLLAWTIDHPGSEPLRDSSAPKREVRKR